MRATACQKPPAKSAGESNAPTASHAPTNCAHGNSFTDDKNFCSTTAIPPIASSFASSRSRRPRSPLHLQLLAALFIRQRQARAAHVLQVHAGTFRLIRKRHADHASSIHNHRERGRRLFRAVAIACRASAQRNNNSQEHHSNPNPPTSSTSRFTATRSAISLFVARRSSRLPPTPSALL